MIPDLECGLRAAGCELQPTFWAVNWADTRVWAAGCELWAGILAAGLVLGYAGSRSPGASLWALISSQRGGPQRGP